MNVTSNAAALVRQVLTGAVWPPLGDRHVYRTGPDGQAFALPGMGGTNRARSPEGWSLVAAGCAVVREAIIGHMVLARAGIAGGRLPRIGVAGATRRCPGQGTGT